MMKKRIAALVTAGVLALSMLTGCGKQTGELESYLPVGTVWCSSDGQPKGCCQVP